MIGTLVQGSPARRAAAGAVHVAASGAVGATSGLVLGWVGSLTPLSSEGRLSLVVAVGVLYGAMELGLVRLPLPQTGRQVPASWRYRFPHLVTAALYGAGLGTGIGTRVASAGFVVVLAAAAFLGGPVVGLALLLVYAVARGLAVVVGAAHGDEDAAKAMVWAYGMTPLWRFLTIVQTFVLVGAGAAVLIG